jgi:predicted dehydrogenase
VDPVTIGVGLAGSGYMGRTYAECLARFTNGARLAAVWGGSRAAALATDYGVAGAASFEALIARPDVDAVVLATPHSMHVDQAVTAAEAGKHVYLEKPMALTAAECDRIIAACRDAGVVLTVNKVSRFRDAPLAARRLLRDGAIGDLRMIHARHIHPEFFIGDKPWALDPAEGTSYLDYGVHAHDQLRWYTGFEPARISAVYASFSPEPPHPRTAHVQVTMADGVLATIWMSYEVPPPGLGPTDQFVLIGSTGIISCDNYGDVQLGRGDDWELAFTQPRPDYVGNFLNPVRLKAFAAQTQDFLDAIREGRPPAVSGEDGRAAVAMVEAADRSAATGGAIAMEPPAA